MSASGPRISVIVPVHDGEAYLAEALASIQTQGEWPLEVIVVDDGSTDATPRIVERVGGACIYRRQVRRGPAAARNLGLGLARGGVIAFLDADDVWPADKLATQVPVLDARPDVDVVLGRVQWLRRAERRGAFEPVGAAASAFHLGCGLFRRRVFERVGPFDVSLRYSEDVDWLLRAREQQVAIAADDRIGLLYRHHAASMTYGRSTQSLDLLHVIKRSLDRRRARGSASA